MANGKDNTQSSYSMQKKKKKTDNEIDKCKKLIT